MYSNQNQHAMQRRSTLQSYDIFRKSLSYFDSKSRLKLLLITSTQILVGILDLAGVVIFGALGALAVSGFGAGVPGDRVQKFLILFHLENFTFQYQAAILGISAGLFLISKTILSIFLSRKSLYFLSGLSVQLTNQFVRRLLSMPISLLKQRSIQDYIYCLNTGVPTIVLGVVGSAVAIITDGSLLIILTIGLLVVNPLLAIATILFFSAITLILYYFLSVSAGRIGAETESLTIESSNLVTEVLSTYRESFVANTRDGYARAIGLSRARAGKNLAELQFMPFVSKYVIEVSIVLGGLLISASQFLLESGSHAVATLAVFLTAGTRIAPAAMRVQQGAIQMRNYVGMTSETNRLLEQMSKYSRDLNQSSMPDFLYDGFSPDVLVENLSVKYSEDEKPALSGINLHIAAGEFIAIVGPSGAGKSTLADAILGITELAEGSVTISGRYRPHQAIEKWPGAISYVPQDTYIADKGIEENIALGHPSLTNGNKRAEKLLKDVQLNGFVAGKSEADFKSLGEFGSKISGGQKQRVGLARGLFTSPKLLILDEATSALDSQTEELITNMLEDLRGQTTVIMIAHRLSTIRNADKVFYISDGRLISQGTLAEVRGQVPDFDRAANLMGL